MVQSSCKLLVVFLDQKLYPTLSLSKWVYKWVPVRPPCDGLASHLGGRGGGVSNAPSRFMLQKPCLIAGTNQPPGSLGPFDCVRTLPYI